MSTQSDSKDDSSDDGASQDVASQADNSDSEADSELSYTERSEVAQDPPPTVIEWGARIFSLIVVLGLIVYVVVAGMQSAAPPGFDLSIDESGIEQRGAAWVVPGSVRNTGDVAIADVVVTLVVEDSEGAVVEEVDLSLPLLGTGETSTGEFWIGSDPSTHVLSLDVASYRVP